MSEQYGNKRRNAEDDGAGDVLPTGATLSRGQYRIDKFLNSGGFGMTYLARNSLDRSVVIKECFPSFLCHRKNGAVEVRSIDHLGDYLALVNHFRAEARALARLNHPNIVGVHEVFDDNNTAYMALDVVKGKDLQEIVENEPQRLGPHNIRQMLMTILGAVSYIHEQGMLHRDISPDNILIDKHNVPVLIDFGSARDGCAKTKAATRLQSVKDGYSPHEFYARKMQHSASSDLYALAATFYYAITGEAPPPSQYRLAALIEKNEDPYVPLAGRFDRYDPRLLETIDRTLAVVAKNRIQTARDWLLAIDDESRKTAALEKARNDARIEQLVRDLVLETNSALKELEIQNARLAAEAEEQRKAEAERLEQMAERRRAMLAEEKAELEAEASNDFEAVEMQASEIAYEVAARSDLEARSSARQADIDELLVGVDWFLEDDNARRTAAQVPLVSRNRNGQVEPTPTARDLAQSNRAASRRGFGINWNLPPLFVSNTAQLAGKIDR